ncbi:MAG: hypothetical protein EHM20_13035 [Alphaproteobacteria bacterium]|nr:MAG: hypothetical protein EHM20_13035 [Alphaproteobacteria bacterium]
MKCLKYCLIIFVSTFFNLTVGNSSALAASIIIDGNSEPTVSGLYLTSNYSDDAACFQAALDNAQSGDTIIIREGDYQISRQIKELNKNLNIIGEGKVTFYLNTSTLPGLYFAGSVITNESLSINAQKGSSHVVLNNASQVHQNDLIKIWKNIQWCPLDYPDQMTTGELYLVKNVSGNVVTLNQPLLRDYNLSETVHVEIYRPIEIHIKNIRVQNINATGEYKGIALQYCKDSSVTDSWFKDNGQLSLILYTCYNLNVINNTIYDSIHEGNGYGISVADASAFVNIENNYIENCRHTIMSGTDDFKALNRDIFIYNNYLIGGNIEGSYVIDSHPTTINYIVTKNRIHPKPGFIAFSDGTLQSTFSENEVYGGSGAVKRRGSVNNGVHVIEGNIIEGTTYLADGNGIGGTLIIKNNTQQNGDYGVVFINGESFRNIVISGNRFSNISDYGIYQKFLIDGVNLSILNNTFENVNQEGIYVDGNNLKSGIVKIQNNSLINVFTSNSTAGIKIKNIHNVSISGNTISGNTISGNTISGNTISGNKMYSLHSFARNVISNMLLILSNIRSSKISV